ncbi:MAG: hypothetical protein U9N34_09585, partial [Candidatus Cloacimonadota bacterium]|nr:hypothetical protein [Candidatus Cloacimonadota bacterium]
MKKSILTLTILLLSFIIFATDNSKKENKILLEKRINAALKLLDNEEIEKSFEIIEQLEKTNKIKLSGKDNYSINLVKARYYQFKNNYDLAFQYLQKVQKKTAKYATNSEQNLVNLRLVELNFLLKKKQKYKVLDDFVNSISATQDSLKAYSFYDVAFILFEQDSYDESIKYLDIAKKQIGNKYR